MTVRGQLVGVSAPFQPREFQESNPVRLGGMHPYQLSHLASPHSCFLMSK